MPANATEVTSAARLKEKQNPVNNIQPAANIRTRASLAQRDHACVQDTRVAPILIQLNHELKAIKIIDNKQS
jgi:hypothetical protein